MFWRQVVASETGEQDVRMAIVQQQSDMLESGLSFSGFERDLVALNRGDATFVNVSGVSGADSITDGRAAVFADFDNDGDADIFLTAMHGPAHLLFRNEIGQDAGFVRVALEGRDSGRDAFGAVVRVKTSAGTLTAVKDGGSGFLSQRDPRLLFGLGGDPRAEWVEVTWPSGAKQRFDGVAAGTSLAVVEGEAKPRVVKERRFSLPDPYEGDASRWSAVTLRPGEPLPDGALDEKLSAMVGGGRRTLINVWATWCASCAVEMPELQRVHAASKDDGVRIVGVSVDEPEARASIPAYLEHHGITYPSTIAPPQLLSSVFRADNVTVPFSILLDGDGRVVDVFEGWSKTTRRRLHAALGTP